MSPRRATPASPAHAQRATLATGLLAVALACAAPAPPAPPPSLPPAPPASPADLPCERVSSLEVRKAERRLLVHCEGGGRREMVVALGREPRGAKREAGDLRTPEGDYRIVGPARRSRFHLFIPIDYPTTADAEIALREGRISRATYRAIVVASESEQLPPQHTPLGGELGIHGEGTRWRGDSQHLDWTTGCLAVTDLEIEFLAERAPPGTPVRIYP